MWKPTETARRLIKGVSMKTRIVLGIGALLLPISVLSGVAGKTTSVTAWADSPRSAQTQKAGTYLLRCWQYGAQIFEEVGLDSPATAGSASLRFFSADRSRGPVHLVTLGSAVCLAKPAQEAAAPAGR